MKKVSGPGSSAAGAVEVLFGLEGATQFFVVGADGQRYRQRARVARDAEELHEAEVAPEFGFLEIVDAARPRVPPRHVHQAALDDVFFDRDPDVAEQRGHIRATSTGTHHEVAPVFRAVVEHDPGHYRNAVHRIAGDQRRDVRVRNRGDVRLRDHRHAEHPLEGGAANDEDGQLVVTRLGLVVEVGDAGHVEAARRVQLFQHVGEAIAHHLLKTGEKAVRLMHLRRALPRGVECFLGVGGGR